MSDPKPKSNAHIYMWIIIGALVLCSVAVHPWELFLCFAIYGVVMFVASKE